MTSMSTWKYRRSRWTRQSVLQKAVIIALLQTIHAIIFISALAPCQLLSSTQCRQRLVKALLPKHPLTFGKIRDDSHVHKQTSLKEGINHSNINFNYNNNSNSNGNNNNNNRNSIPAHEQLLSSTKTNTQRDNDGAGLPPSYDTSPLPLPTTANVAPLKVMVFIDGTWLYYSIYEREFDRDVIAQKLGKYWKTELTPDWSSLPTVACQALLQDPKSKWSAIMPVGVDESDNMDSMMASKTAQARPIEVARVSVYSSMHRDTPKDSLRYKMFAEMIKAGFDVNMMETVGKGEKCVDIQLAVDMLYYATVPDAYDVALLLTGDRDFLPAVIRCRQKGRRIGLVSMRTGSLAFEVTPNLKDYDTIWMEDYLSQWIRKKTPEELGMSTALGKKKSMSTATNTSEKSSQISAYTLNKVITNFIGKSGEPRVSSRDIGRHLKSLSVCGKPMLDEIKAVYGGLYQFLILSEIYLVIADSRRAVKAFWVALHDNKENFKEPTQEGTLSEDEKKFLTSYGQWVPMDKNKEFYFTMNEPDLASEQLNSVPKVLGNFGNLEGDSPSVDYNELTITELKDICREKGLKISAKKKIELVERIEEHISESKNLEPKNAELSPERHLKSLVLEYLYASGGQASSRDVGRYLAANKVSSTRRLREESTGRHIHALAELKEIYGSLNTFVKNLPEFYIVSAPGHEFNICIDKESMGKQSSQ